MEQSSYILLVEDNPDDEALILRALRRNRVANTVLVARDGEETLRMLLEPGADTPTGGPLPDLILLDLRLPKLSGLQVLDRIRGDPRTKLLPVVILTTSSEDRDIVESYSRGANSYVRKPVDFAEFVDAVGQLGLYWLLYNERPPRRASS